jgi:hypothetical protein
MISSRFSSSEGEIMTPVATLTTMFDKRFTKSDYALWRLEYPTMLQLLRNLSYEEAVTLVKILIAEYPPHIYPYLCGMINTFIPGSLQLFTNTFLAQRTIHPGWLFLDADDDVARKLLAMIKEPDAAPLRNHLLLALAWIGNETVQAQFDMWRTTPPAWREDMYVPPESYSYEAGWELTSVGTRHNLYFNDAIELISTDGASSPVVTGTTLDEACQWCHRELVTLFAIDFSDTRYQFLLPASGGDALLIPICPWCSYYESIFFDCTPTGQAQWNAHNGEKSLLLRQLKDDGAATLPSTPPLMLGKRRRTPFEVVGLDYGLSQLGGHPAWINDAEYPECPRCSQRMPCIGQVSGGEWHAMSEGIFYLFFCSSCWIATTSYDQT